MFKLAQEYDLHIKNKHNLQLSNFVDQNNVKIRNFIDSIFLTTQDSFQ